MLWWHMPFPEWAVRWTLHQKAFIVLFYFESDVSLICTWKMTTWIVTCKNSQWGSVHLMKTGIKCQNIILGYKETMPTITKLIYILKGIDYLYHILSISLHVNNSMVDFIQFCIADSLSKHREICRCIWL